MAVNDGVPVGNSSGAVLLANGNRKTANLVNDSDETIYLAKGEDAELNKGIRLNAGGGNFEINASNMWKGTVNAICTSGGKNLCVSETTEEK